jgi:hypothetical protein
LYAPYLQANDTAVGPGLPRDVLTPRLAGLYAADDAAFAACPFGVPGLGYDPLADAQDWRLSDLTLTTTGGADRATVKARFQSFGEASVVVFSLEKVDGLWRVDDVVGRAGKVSAALAPRPTGATPEECAAARKVAQGSP